ncbi:MAG: adenosine deaminase, partial [Verrucomicrobia bacterium]|nr:adenosine deaminase [Verrucomicrobiota bacterium]
ISPLRDRSPWKLLQKANPGKYLSPPASWEPDFRYDNFAHFENQLLSYAGYYFQSADRYHECAKSVFADRLTRNVRYMEVSFASGCIDYLNLNGREVCDAIRDALPQGLEVRIFLGMHHDGYTPKMKPILNEALTWPNLDGIDLHGAEDVPIGDWAPWYWKKARDAGKFTKAHAGEFMGADFVQYVVEALGVQRIEHGIRSIEDPAVLDLLCERGIALDVSPISNLKLGDVPSASAHPLRRLMDSGITCTISTDDPICFGNDIEDEY